MTQHASSLDVAQHGGLMIRAAMPPEYHSILTPQAQAFLVDLQRRFSTRVGQLLEARQCRQQDFDAGGLPDFPAETADLRAADWQVDPIPADLTDRRVEITGPVDRKMIINALNSGACVFMADFEDSLSPTWANVMDGQINLRDAVNRNIEYLDPEGRHYRLDDKTAVLIVRPRGWHLPEKHVRLDGVPFSAALYDFGLYLFHNAVALIASGSGPYFYLPKLESRHEAALWREVFGYAEHRLGLKAGSIKVTVLIETLPAVFEMDEILHELRAYIVGLNCGRWDYIFSFIKKLHAHPDCILPERGQVTMTTHFLRAYSRLLIKTCHRRGAFAIGGMAAQIPIRGDEAANAAALEKVRDDKEREAGDGHDGTWVAHPGLVPVAKEVFDRYLQGDNQLDRKLTEVEISRNDLLQVPQGSITEAGLRNNINVAIRYLASWLGGNGCVPINHLMEDAATAEIARAQLWQWLHLPGVQLEDGRSIDFVLFDNLLQEELQGIGDSQAGADLSTGIQRAATLLNEITKRKDFAEFITLIGYDDLT